MGLSVARICWAICKQRHSLSKNKETVVFSIRLRWRWRILAAQNTYHVPMHGPQCRQRLFGVRNGIPVVRCIDIARLTCSFPFLFFLVRGSSRTKITNNHQLRFCDWFYYFTLKFRLINLCAMRFAGYTRIARLCLATIAARSVSADFHPTTLSTNEPHK